MRISQHSLNAVHRLEEQVLGQKLSPVQRIAAADIVQTAIDSGDMQQGKAWDQRNVNREIPRYVWKDDKWVRWEPQPELTL
jgi:hypothetical protein